MILLVLAEEEVDERIRLLSSLGIPFSLLLACISRNDGIGKDSELSGFPVKECDGVDGLQTIDWAPEILKNKKIQFENHCNL